MQKIHFIGIGGIGVSALARFYLKKGYQVSGSDLVSSEITDELKRNGAKIFIGRHSQKNLPSNVWKVVYSPAVSFDNPELQKAKKLKIKIQSYPEALGELTKQYFTIAVSGTHGKSTTSAMIGLMLTKAKLDPTVIIGTKLKEFHNSNCRVGKSKYLVIEADEYKASFLCYWPSVIVLTSIEREHLDYYKNLRHILKTYLDYVNHLKERKGVLVANQDDKNIRKLLKLIKKDIRIKKYSLTQKEAKEIKQIMAIPGIHNVSNALAALEVGKLLNIKKEVVLKSLSSFKGSWRRFEIEKVKIPETKKKIILINDYAHHPTELQVTLKAAREKFPQKNIWVIFQPHQYQRTFYFFKDFVKKLSLAEINHLIIIDIYDVAGRENQLLKEKVSAKKLVEAIKKKRNKRVAKVSYIPNIEEAFDFLKNNLPSGSVLMIVGAGDIYNINQYFHLTQKQKKETIKK
ncbi:UDP-N-acetylmuramate--L-alanine ligase [bacterium]|nr:UDP-N-acetylmuramate--L-alanine ligase [bacterium]